MEGLISARPSALSIKDERTEYFYFYFPLFFLFWLPLILLFYLLSLFLLFVNQINLITQANVSSFSDCFLKCVKHKLNPSAHQKASTGQSVCQDFLPVIRINILHNWTRNWLQQTTFRIIGLRLVNSLLTGWETFIGSWMFQVCLALRYLHKEKRIVHRDLTPNNIMLGEKDKVTISESEFILLHSTFLSSLRLELLSLLCLKLTLVWPSRNRRTAS